MLQIHSKLAQSMGMNPKNIFIGEIGTVFELSSKTCKVKPSVPAGKATISQIVKMRLRIIGINDPKITAHSLRHTCGSLLVEMGTDIEIIKDLLGHSDSSTTRIYVDMAQKRRLLRENPSRQIEALLSKK